MSVDETKPSKQKIPIARVTVTNYITCMRMIISIWTQNDLANKAKFKKAYLDHYAHVRAIVPKDNLLEFKSEDGWEPLCKFLGKPVPDGPYPHINDSKAVVNLHHYLWWSIWAKWVAWNGLKVVVPVLGAWGYWRYTKA